QLRQVTLLRSSVAFFGSRELYRKETFPEFPHSAQRDHLSRISRRARCTKCMTLLIDASILSPQTHHLPLYAPRPINPSRSASLRARAATSVGTNPASTRRTRTND